MIRPLRRAHGAAFVVLAVLMPLLIVSAWRARRAPVHQELPPEYLPGSPTPIFFLGTDELVYWADEYPEDKRTLPREAELVGTIRSGALDLAPPPGKQRLRYSLPHRLLDPTAKELSEAPARVKEDP